jgi:hypothetical protein
MAKSFKNLPRPGEPGATVKPASERDFFDLTSDTSSKDASTNKKVAPIIENTDGSNISNTSNNNNINNTNNTNNIDNISPATSTPNLRNTNEEVDVRQTFVVSSSQLEQLRDHVHARRAGGDYGYSQKQALQEALSLLFASASPAPPRPAHTRELEQQRQQRIKRGRETR